MANNTDGKKDKIDRPSDTDPASTVGFAKKSRSLTISVGILAVFLIALAAAALVAWLNPAT